jgi:hypothetical protein
MGYYKRETDGGLNGATRLSAPTRATWSALKAAEVSSDGAVEIRRRLGYSTFGDHAPLLLANGYSPLPIEPNAKRPLAVLGDWGRLRTAPLTPEDIAAIAAQHPDAGLGVVGGYGGLVPVDIDTDDEEIVAAIMTALPPPLVGKRGRRGVTHFFRSIAAVPAGKIRRADGAPLVEILTTGQTLIPPTIHPEMGQPYRWTDAELTLRTVAVEKLPEITAAHVGVLEAALAPWMAPKRAYASRPVTSAEPFSQTRMRAYAEAALKYEANALRGMAKNSGRNNALFVAVCKLGKFVHHAVLSENELKDALLDASRANGLIAEEGRKACEGTIASGLRKAEGDELPVLEDRPRSNGRLNGATSPADRRNGHEHDARVLNLMDLGLGNKEIQADIGPVADIDRLRARWNGEGRRMRSHAKSGSNGSSHANVRLDGAVLLDEVYNFLGRFVAFPSEEAHVAHTLWIAHCHAMDAWESTPRLAFLSPEPGSGKTRALEASELLVPNPVEAINVTPAYLFRKVGSPEGRPTILFDEVDTIFGPKAGDHEEVRGLLNAGHRKGAVAGRCAVRGKIVETEEIPAYCAVALAGLGNLPDTILSRSVVVRMRRRAPDEQVEPFRRRLLLEEGERLRSDLAAWAASAIGDVIDAWPEMPEQIKDRDADVWEALLAVADVAGSEWPERARKAAVALVTQSKEMTPSLGLRLLADLRTVFGTEDKLPTEKILRALHVMDEAPWGDLRGRPMTDRDLAKLLKPYEIKPKLVKIAGEVSRGYQRTDLHDAWLRYLPPLPQECVTGVTSVTELANSGLRCNAWGNG